MTATAHVALVVDNTGTQKQRSKRNTPSQSFLTDQHPIYGGKAEVVRTQQSGVYWHFRMWISEERKYVRKTLKTTHLDTAIQRAENEFFAIKANVNAGKRIFSPTVQQAADEYLKHTSRFLTVGIYDNFIIGFWRAHHFYAISIFTMDFA